MMMRGTDVEDGKDNDGGQNYCQGLQDHNPRTWCLALVLPPSSRAPCRPTEARSGELRSTQREDYTHCSLARRIAKQHCEFEYFFATSAKMEIFEQLLKYKYLSSC